MRDERRNYLIVGAFVLAVLAGLILWIAMLAGRTGATDSYHVIYASVMGIAPGTQVFYEGYPVGFVEALGMVEADGPRRFRVDLAVRRGWSIPEDSRAAIHLPGFLAPVVIDIRGGSSSTLLEPGAEIASADEPDLVAAVSDGVGKISQLVDGLEPLLDSLNEGAPEIVANLREFSGDLNQTGDRLNAMLTPQNVERVDAILANLQSVSSDVSRFAQNLGETRERLDRLLVRADALLDEDEGKLDHAITDLHDSLEAVARHVDAIAHDLEVTTRNLAEFTRQIRENPGVILRGRSGAN